MRMHTYEGFERHISIISDDNKFLSLFSARLARRTFFTINVFDCIQSSPWCSERSAIPAAVNASAPTNYFSRIRVFCQGSVPLVMVLICAAVSSSLASNDRREIDDEWLRNVASVGNGFLGENISVGSPVEFALRIEALLRCQEM